MIIRDGTDLEKFEFGFDQYNPLPPDCSLMSLSKGIIGGFSINGHMALRKGL